MNKETKENTKPPSKKIPYTKPTITCVKLDPKQAILSACIRYSAPGAWMAGEFGHLCVYGGSTGALTSCSTSPRGSVHQMNHRYAPDPEVGGS